MFSTITCIANIYGFFSGSQSLVGDSKHSTSYQATDVTSNASVQRNYGPRSGISGFLPSRMMLHETCSHECRKGHAVFALLAPKCKKVRVVNDLESSLPYKGNHFQTVGLITIICNKVCEVYGRIPAS
jgi:hypothetical protein